ncbi:type VII secretion integral membrane protein EccD [Amycolatopsis marina]|nr:type VII secretion integral membrane protein EccD [Amycolatopsis marina]
MTVASGAALAKVTIATPNRTIDVALPEDVPVAELLPYILRHAGDDAPDAGERHGGWLLRRPTGDQLDGRKTLGAQEVLDGEVMHLVPGNLEWPELEYDDVVETIASGARRYGRSWGHDATRRCGLAASCAILLAGTLVTIAFEPAWLVPGLTMLGVAAVLTGLGVAVAGAVPDARAGAVFAGCALPYAFIGGWLLTGPDHLGPMAFGAPQLLLASITLLVFSVVGYLAVGATARIFAAAVAVAVLGALGALLATSMEPDGAAAVVLAVGIGLLPGYPLLAIRLGRLPLPALPQSAEELLRDEPLPPPPTVFAAAARTDEILSGLLLGLATVAAVCSVFLAVHGGGARLIMLGAVAVALLLRSRLFAVPRQRIPLLISGMAVAAMLMATFVVGAQSNTSRTLLLLGMAAIAGMVAFAGLTYSKRNPSPYLGRLADVFDVVAILALVPFTCYITGFFTFVQGLMAGIG